MPAILSEHQHELIDGADESRSIVFGTQSTGFMTLSPPTWTGGDSRDGDVDRPSEDGRYFGRDLRGALTVGFEIAVLTDHLATADSDAYRTNVDYLDELRSWWDDEDLRDKPWKYAVLRSCVAGRTWITYGRPRRYDESPTMLQQRGYTAVVCDFAGIDNNVYADVVQQQVVPLVVVPTGGGLLEPLVEPLNLTENAAGKRITSIGGRRPTWAWVQFNGPVDKPRVQIGDLVIGLNSSIPAGLSVTVDPRPWSRGVYRNDGANYANALSFETPVLRQAKVRPGDYEAVYSGIDATGTSTCVVSWREARGRP